MRPYGETPRAGKLHDADTCPICADHGPRGRSKDGNHRTAERMRAKIESLELFKEAREYAEALVKSWNELPTSGILDD